MHGARGGSKAGAGANSFKHGGRTKEAEQVRKNANHIARQFAEISKYPKQEVWKRTGVGPLALQSCPSDKP
jgi:hypothetical protein